MRRIDLINASNNVYRAFNESRIVLQIFNNPQEGNEPSVIMQSYMTYMKFYEKFGEAEKKIIKTFDLDGLEDSSLWAKILSSDIKESRDQTRLFFRSVTYIIDFLPSLIELLKQEHVEYPSTNSHLSTASNVLDKEIITVILPENDIMSSNPDRLIITLQSIESFYITMSILQNINFNDLSVVAIDSGSDKSFDFLGNAKVITEVKELILDIWDRVIFHREKKFDKKLELIAKSLPVFEKIKELEDSKALEPEQAEILRRNIIGGTKNFVNAGAILPEFEDNNTYDPKRLMAPEPKLLTMPSGQLEESITNTSVNSKEESEDLIGLSDEEKEILKKLLAKNKGELSSGGTKKVTRRKPGNK